MVLLGLLLLCAVAAFTGLLIADNLDGGPSYTVTVLGNDIATMNSLSIFLAGIALTLLFGIALLLLLAGSMRARRRSRERAALTAAATLAGAEAPAATPAAQDATPTAGPPTAGAGATQRKHRLHLGH
ncbi:hypothetical protein ACIRBX_24885 [Kitasatospora sp. NPDC096147]|uniref:hypothetical protein n=1 Tax=Kitasatospora sp. NPDC096147 TaxID=3364093 RepID=UPI0037F4D004